jgi:hypothetical protein
MPQFSATSYRVCQPIRQVLAVRAREGPFRKKLFIARHVYHSVVPRGSKVRAWSASIARMLPSVSENSCVAVDNGKSVRDVNCFASPDWGISHNPEPTPASQTPRPFSTNATRRVQYFGVRIQQGTSGVVSSAGMTSCHSPLRQRQAGSHAWPLAAGLQSPSATT